MDRRVLLGYKAVAAAVALIGMLSSGHALAADEAPAAVVSISNGEFAAPAAVAFDGSSSGPDARTFSWDFGDGSTGSGASTTHTYAAAGNFTATLTVTNASGVSSAPASAQVVVKDASAPLPVTSFTGKFGKPGKVSGKLVLNLPSGTSLGSSVSLVLGTQKLTFAMMGGTKGLAKKGSNVAVSGSAMKFKILGSAKSIFGSVVTSGSKTIAITVNGIAYTSTVSFSTNGMVTSFH